MGRVNDIAGEKFGRLTAIRLHSVEKGDARWVFSCECGAEKIAKACNVKGGSVTSCGCFRREVQAARWIDFAPVVHSNCSVDGCDNVAREYDDTLCRKHGQRMRRYGDPLFVTSEEVRRDRQRESVLKNFPTVKPTTYRKLNGRHEHRVIGERKAGRPLRSDEHVHHIDENKHNNDPSNLVVLSREEHLTLHARRLKYEAS